MKPGLSTYSQKKNLFTKKVGEKKSSHQPIKFNTMKKEVEEKKPFMPRNKSELFEAEGPVGFMSDRIRHK